MTIRTGLLMFLATACIGPARGQDQPAGAAGKPSAKQIFLTRQIPYVDPDETPAPAKPKPKSNAKPNLAPKPQPKPAEAASSGQANSASPADVKVVPASYVPLGLRYTLRKMEDDRTTDAAAETVFHSGDHIQLSLEVNDAGYLYVVSQGSSHKWTVLFPSSEIENGDNSVQRGHSYTVPPGRKAIAFDDQSGDEHLFVILSRQPVQEIDSLIFSLKGGHQPPATDPGKERPGPKVLTASAQPLEDSQIAQIRSTYTRDLIVEDLGHEQSSGQQQDKSVYVVNPTGSADSRVVADIPLTHK